jgi:hypothetical protein
VSRARTLLVLGVAATFAGTSFAAPSLLAQGNRFALGGGASFPTGNYDDIANVGWHLTGSVNFGRHDSRFGFLVDGTYGEFGLDSEGLTGGPLEVRQRWIYGTGNLVYRFKRAGASHANPYLIGGAGVYTSKGVGADADLFGDTSSTDFGVNAGVGLNYTVSRIVLFAEARYHTVFSDPSDTHYIPLTIGIRFGR